MTDPEPFSTRKLWDALTLEAYQAQPTRGGYHYRLDESCNESEIALWREWCRRYPQHWPRHVRDYIARVRASR